MTTLAGDAAGEQTVAGKGGIGVPPLVTEEPEAVVEPPQLGAPVEAEAPVPELPAELLVKLLPEVAPEPEPFVLELALDEELKVVDPEVGEFPVELGLPLAEMALEPTGLPAPLQPTWNISPSAKHKADRGREATAFSCLRMFFPSGPEGLRRAA